MKKNISIKRYTTFKIGGKAKYFIKLRKKEKIKETVQEIKEKKLPFLIIGGGSNILADDKGYSGVILKIDNRELQVKDSKIFIGAGAPLSLAVGASLKNSLTGLEWASGIPGTVGGAIYGNAAAFGFSVKDCLESVDVFNIKKEKLETVSVSKCQYGNKESLFKKNKDLIIVSAVFKLKKGRKEEIEKKMKELISKRKKSHPNTLPSAGCIFKNYEGKILDKKIIEKFPELEKFNKWGMIPVSYLIEKSNLKGKKVGGVKVSNKHANFIVNTDKGKKKDVLELIKIIKKEVKKIFGIKIEEEVQKL
ncbi:MAG: UDP-N-acetylmuramate dehydrogenase [Candidatus Paceibacterota bacterium]